MSPARLSLALFVLLLASGGSAGLAQTDSSSLPDDPSLSLTQQTTASSATNSAAQAGEPSPPPQSTSGSYAGKQTKRILGIIPNFRSVSVDAKLPPESAKDKFRSATQDAFDYSDFIYVGIVSGVGQAENSYPEFHQGAAGYGRYYWHTLADQVDEDYQVEFVFPALTREDPRFYTLGRGGFFRRTGYAFSRIFITRTDSGGETFNFSETIGAGAASGISDLYYPSLERTWTKTGQRWVLNIGLDGGTYIFQEFWPSINNRFFHQKD